MSRHFSTDSGHSAPGGEQTADLGRVAPARGGFAAALPAALIVAPPVAASTALAVAAGVAYTTSEPLKIKYKAFLGFFSCY